MAMAHPDRGRLVVLRTPYGPQDQERGIKAYSAYEVVVDEMHIHTLAVHPLHRRAGLGKMLLRTVLDLGARRGAAVALLEVRKSNWTALALYRSFGFSHVASRKDYYEHPREDALLLEKRDLPDGVWK
jgi:ribosomal-protein-alanine N-acetyltransferase